MGFEPHVGLAAWFFLPEANDENGCIQTISGGHDVLLEHEDTYGEENILTRGQEVQDVGHGLKADLRIELNCAQLNPSF